MVVLSDRIKWIAYSILDIGSCLMAKLTYNYRTSVEVLRSLDRGILNRTYSATTVTYRGYFLLVFLVISCQLQKNYHDPL